MKKEYWTLFFYGGNETICSKHKTLLAAKREVKNCESRGGNVHRIIHVQEVIGYKNEKRTSH